MKYTAVQAAIGLSSKIIPLRRINIGESSSLALNNLRKGDISVNHPRESKYSDESISTQGDNHHEVFDRSSSDWVVVE